MADKTEDTAKAKRNSTVSQGSDSSAAVFNDDKDDSYSVSDMALGKKEGKQKDKEVSRPKFDQATISKWPAGPDKDKHTERMSISDEFPELDDLPPYTDGANLEPPYPETFFAFCARESQCKDAPVYSCAALPQPLLQCKDKADYLAAMASWAIILRIMGDIPDPDFGDSLILSGETPPLMSKVTKSFDNKYTKKDIEEAQRKYSEFFKDPTNGNIEIPFLLSGHEAMLEKVQYLCGLGIYRPELRDELYCQLCRQLTHNPSRSSSSRGWVLMKLFAGSFSPTERFVPCFLRFLKDGPQESCKQVERLLRKTFVIGTRGYPPSWLEFQAAKNSKPILLPITMMNGVRYLLKGDSGTTVSALCRDLSEQIGVQDIDGFSIYITLFQKISCLGHGLHRVMDAVAECELHTKQMGMRESHSTWRLYFRKEYFSPWHNAKLDVFATDLIHNQVMRGICVGEYKCEKDEMLVLMAAQRFYLEFSDMPTADKLKSFVKSWIPSESLKAKDNGFWEDAIKNVLEKEFQGKNVSPVSLKIDIVNFTKENWHLPFSRFYDALRLSGPDISWSAVILAVNWKGFYVIDDMSNSRLEILYMEIVNVSRESRHTVIISTLLGEDYFVTSPHADDLYEMLTTNLQGLRERSRHAIVLPGNIGEPAVTNSNIMAPGDYVYLGKPIETPTADTKVTATIMKSETAQNVGNRVECAQEDLYILPTIYEPASSALATVIDTIKKNASPYLTKTDPPASPTLQAYAKVHFKLAQENAVSKLLNKASFKKDRGFSTWKHSKEPLRRALLKRSNTKPELQRASVRCFNGILHYMGDAPNKYSVEDIDLANDIIIAPALRNRYLREEVFCQLIKQLTNNPDTASADRGWRLLWLICGCASPHRLLHEEISRILLVKTHGFSSSCRERLQRVKLDGFRQYPPHVMEHDAIRQGQFEMKVSILLPDKSKEVLTVQSTSRVSMMCAELAARLNLKSPDEYSLFLGTMDRVVSMSMGDYFFDYLSHADVFWTKSRSSRRSSSSFTGLPAVFFMKKLWINTSPELDPVADSCFHYPQELPNYIRGYHKCVSTEASRLAAYVYRAKCGDNKEPLITNPSAIVQSILPKELIQTQSIETWGKLILEAHDATTGLTKDEAKSIFLKILHGLPTYGSVFFEVKQRATRTIGVNTLMAINKDGVMLINPQTKEIQSKYSFNMIPNWTYDDTTFTLVVGDNSNSSRVTLETTVGHNLDDIIMSYITWIMNTNIRRKHGYSGSQAGESLC